MAMRLDLFHHYPEDQEVPLWVVELIARADLILDRLDILMTTVAELQAKADETLAQVTAETDLDNAIAKVVTDQNATITDLKAQLAAAGTDPAELQKVMDTMDAILQTNTSNTKIVSDAVTANTPAA
jgi:hypothetical protein